MVYYGPDHKKALWDKLSQKDLDEKFYQAVQEKNIQKADDFLNQGAFLYGAIKEGALKTNDNQVIDFIDEKIKLNQELFKAIKDDDAEKIWNLSLKNVSAKGMNEEGVPAIVMAAKEGAKRAFLMLANNFELKVDQADSDGKTALMWAAQKNDAEMVEWLLSMGAEASLMDNHEKEAIIYAVENKGFEAVQKLMNFEEMDMIQKALQKAKELNNQNIISVLTLNDEVEHNAGLVKISKQNILPQKQAGDYQRES